MSTWLGLALVVLLLVLIVVVVAIGVALHSKLDDNQAELHRQYRDICRAVKSEALD